MLWHCRPYAVHSTCIYNIQCVRDNTVIVTEGSFVDLAHKQDTRDYDLIISYNTTSLLLSSFLPLHFFFL